MNNLRITLCGFTAFERATFETFFQLTSKRATAYVAETDPRLADFVIADADDDAVFRDLQALGRLGRTLMMGRTVRAAAAAQLPRPINLMLVIRALDGLSAKARANVQAFSAARNGPANVPVPAVTTPALPGIAMGELDLVLRTAAIPAGVNPRDLAAASAAVAEAAQAAAATALAWPTPAPSPWSDRFKPGPHPAMAAATTKATTKAATTATATASATAARPEPAAVARVLAPTASASLMPALRRTNAPLLAPTAAHLAHSLRPARHASGPHSGPTMDHILVVDDSDVALRFMTLHLQRFGFEIHLVRSGSEAIEKVAKRHFEFVFLDVMMEGLDGYQTCRVIKRTSYPDRRPPPTVVMVTSRNSAMDKLRGTMAGCDAYLTKPLEEAALLKVIGDREVAHIGFSDTAASSAPD